MCSDPVWLLPHWEGTRHKVPRVICDANDTSRHRSHWHRAKYLLLKFSEQVIYSSDIFSTRTSVISSKSSAPHWNSLRTKSASKVELQRHDTVGRNILRFSAWFVGSPLPQCQHLSLRKRHNICKDESSTKCAWNDSRSHSTSATCATQSGGMTISSKSSLSLNWARWKTYLDLPPLLQAVKLERKQVIPVWFALQSKRNSRMK